MELLQSLALGEWVLRGVEKCNFRHHILDLDSKF